ncbi:MAG TPA: NAD(P)/FAD-dependent oxidoreductase [Candidatus Sulfotelmatobacter sp.]|nr:NAD(P)/FAD-dependent oxidoreductase [Candidatus Sulfotelmatobacter sp.]
MSASQKTRILILGGGFAGLHAAIYLDDTLARSPDVEITLINRDNFFLFTPMLHEVAASDLDLSNIVSPVRQLLKRVHFFAGEVESIDLERKKVRVSHGFDRHHHDLPYDHVVIGVGSITNFFDIPGLEERALTMKSLGDAIHLRNRLIALLEEADTECSADIRGPLLTFVVAGGGFAGGETVAAINDFVRHAVRYYSNLRENMLRVVLVHPGGVILPELGEKLGRYTQEKLSKRGVEVRVQTRVAMLTEKGVELSTGEMIETAALIWTAGTSPNPVLATLPCEKERGRLKVNQMLQAPNWPGVWALGDCAVVPDGNTGNFYPPTAQHALREGKVVAHNLIASVRGGAMKPFSFSTIGQLAAIGQRSGVANIFGVNFSGFVAWWLWRTIYLSKLPRFEKKLRVALNWTLDLLFGKDLVQFQTFRAPTISMKEEDMGAMRMGGFSR